PLKWPGGSRLRRRTTGQDQGCGARGRSAATFALLTRSPVGSGFVVLGPLLQLLHQRGAVELQNLGGLVLVAAGTLERLVDETIFELGERRVEVDPFRREGNGVRGRRGKRSRSNGRRPDRSGQIRERDLARSPEHREPLDEVLQLADVARPSVSLERNHRGGGEGKILCGRLVDEVPDEDGHVSRALP